MRGWKNNGKLKQRTQMTNMNEKNDALRAVAFEQATVLHKRVLTRLVDAGHHLKNRNRRAAIRSLARVEAGIETLHTLMVFLHNWVEPDDRQKGSAL